MCNANHDVHKRQGWHLDDVVFLDKRLEVVCTRSLVLTKYISSRVQIKGMRIRMAVFEGMSTQYFAIIERKAECGQYHVALAVRLPRFIKCFAYNRLLNRIRNEFN